MSERGAEKNEDFGEIETVSSQLPVTISSVSIDAAREEMWKKNRQKRPVVSFPLSGPLSR